MKKTLILALALLALSGCKAPHYWKGADIGWATEYESRGHAVHRRGGLSLPDAGKP